MRFRILYVIIFCLLGQMVIAQKSDPLSYYLVLKDSTSYYCKIPYSSPGKWMSAKINGRDSMILWKYVKGLYVVNDDGEKTDVADISPISLNEMRIYAKDKNRWAKWNEAFVVKQNGDTILGRIKPHPEGDYSVLLDAGYKEMGRVTGLFDGRIVLIVDGEERDFFPVGLTELYIYNKPPDFSRYVFNNLNCLRVVVDGTCMLLYKKYVNYSIEEDAAEVYSILYKGEIVTVRTEHRGSSILWKDLNVDIGFKAHFTTLFADCPEIVSEIESGVLKSTDLVQIVERFNACIAQ